MEDRRVKRLGTIWRLIVLLGLTSGIAYLALHREFLQRSLLERELLCFGRLASIFFVLVYAAATVLFVPGSILTIAGGVLFGPARNALESLGCDLGGDAGLFDRPISCLRLGFTERGRAAGSLDARSGAGRMAFRGLVRLVPLFPFNLMNYAIGLTRIRIAEYVIASFVCMAPGALAYTWLGFAGREAASGQSAAIREGLLGLALLAAVAFLPRLIHRRKGPRFIDPDELKRRLESGERLALIDVRTPDEFFGPLGHIASARNIPVGDLLGSIGKINENRQKALITI
jgi:uncharacterized membrane protein YdjX (TVP38/TMEM64 family)